ncbi:hypothetical protein CBL_10132 [Carabus blaptoides fortunei]
MDSSFENNWYERLVELNIDLAQTNTATECDLHLQEVCCNTLQEKVNDLKRDISKLEDDYEIKRVKLNNISQMDEMLNQNLASLDDLIATKEFCLQLMQENYEQKQKNIKENDKIASSIMDKFERNYRESKANFDKCSLAQKYHQLKNDVLERKIKVAILRKKIEVQKAKNKLRSDIQRKLKQQKIIRLAEVMVQYYSAQKSKSNLNKAENYSENLQMQPKPLEDSSPAVEDTDPKLVKDGHVDTNLARLNYEEIISLLQFKTTDYRPAAQLNISVNQYRQSAIPQLPVVQKRNIKDGASSNSSYEPTNLHDLSMQKLADQGASLITDVTAVNNCTAETADTNITSSGEQTNVPKTDTSATTAELSTMDKTEMTDDTEISENITVCPEVQNIDTDISTDQTKIELGDNIQSQQEVIEESIRDKSDDNNFDSTSSQREEQPSMMRPEGIDRNIVDNTNSVSEEQKQEFNIDTDLLQYKYIDDADILNDNEYEMPTFKPASQQSDSSSASVISFSVSNTDKNSGLIENIPTNAFNMFAAKKDEDKSTEPFQLTFNQPLRKPNSIFSMF